MNSQTVDLETKRSLLNYRHNTDLQFEVRLLCIFSIYFLSFNSLKKCQKVCLKQVKVKCVSSYLILRILNGSYFGRRVLTIVVYSKFHHLYSSV